MSPVVTLEDFLSSYLVAGLSNEQAQQVFDLGKIESVREGVEILTKSSDECDLIVLISGEVKVYGAGSILLAELGPNSVFGELALVDDFPRSAYVISSADSTFVRFDGKVLRRFMVEHKDTGFIILSNLSRVLSMRLRQASKRIEEMRKELRDPWYMA